MEELMEEAYEQYLNKKEGTTKQRKRMKKKHAEDGELLEVWLFTFSSYSFVIFLCCLFMSLLRWWNGLIGWVSKWVKTGMVWVDPQTLFVLPFLELYKATLLNLLLLYIYVLLVLSTFCVIFHPLNELTWFKLTYIVLFKIVCNVVWLTCLYFLWCRAMRMRMRMQFIRMKILTTISVNKNRIP